MGVSGQTDVSAVGVGLLGLGVVGSAVAKALLSRDESKEHNIPLALVSAVCLLYTSPSPRDGLLSRMPSSA